MFKLCNTMKGSYLILLLAVFLSCSRQNLELLGVVPQDEGVFDYDSAGTPTTQLPADNPVRQELYHILEGLGL